MDQLAPCSIDSLKQAAKNLKKGALVAFPTETVYGLGVDAENESAVARMYQVKGRPANHPVIVHISNQNQVEYWAQDIPVYAIALMRKFWPGPMTLILKRSEQAKDFVTGGQDYVGLRIPSNPIALKLLSEFEALGGHGVAAPSANRFGSVSPTSASDVKDEIGDLLGAEDLILDGGACEVGVESTIIDCSRELPRILRLGAVTEAMIEEIKEIDSDSDLEEIRVSGSLTRHYSPRAQVVIDRTANPGEGLIALSEVVTPEGAIRLSSPKSIDDYARSLYSALRRG
ncbi:MAG: threonylcarbamoyl-AMP synthase, partial [Candidatus Nanopelagicaceae bacterium]|nr:threonylcarbamoyl-AMP synthase [Candidatus Nanopelagicaceae bacterium]